MHIVFVTNELATEKNPSGGLASFTANMARIFTAKGHSVTILLISGNRKAVRFDEQIELRQLFISEKQQKKISDFEEMLYAEQPDKKRKIAVALYDIIQSYNVRKEIAKLDAARPIDIIHYCNLCSPSLLAGRKIPYVVRLSSFYNISRGAQKRQFSPNYGDNPRDYADTLDYLTLKRTRAIISPSRINSELGYEMFGRKIKVLESPFLLNDKDWDCCLYDKQLKGKKYILHFGRLGYLKGTHILAEIIYDVLKTDKELYVVIAGRNDCLYDEQSGSNVSAYELVKRRASEFSDRVIYLGQLVREQLYPVIKHSHICLLPSRTENFPNACIEAMAMSRIVIGTNRASFEQLITDGVNGFLGERDRPETFLKAIKRALDLSDESRKKMMIAAEETTRRLRPEAVYRKYYDFYKWVIEKWNR